MESLMDRISQSQRSWNMSQIKRENTKPELKLRKALWNKGLRYRLKIKVFGKPDIIFKKYKVAVFVDGCFWHKCPEHFSYPKSNQEFWKVKINKNVIRDKKVNEELRNLGWTVLRFWEHELNDDLCEVVNKIIRAVN
jgi:DNA mismatch endonuclease, patch repair protein